MSLRPSTSDSVSSLSEPQRNALISLLADDDPAVHQHVRNKLLASGSPALQWLQPYSLHQDPILRARARAIIEHFQRESSDTAFLNFCRHSGEDFDLESAVGMLVKTRYPLENWDAYRALWDQWADEVLDHGSSNMPLARRISYLSHYLFRTQHLQGDPQYPLHPESAYLNKIMDRRQGNPIGLCTIYLFIARRLSLPVTGIGLPGHFVCRCQSPTFETYIDCFNHGRFLLKRDCILHIQKTNPSADPSQLTPVSPRRWLMRMCANLQQTYIQLDLSDEALRMNRYLDALVH